MPQFGFGFMAGIQRKVAFNIPSQKRSPASSRTIAKYLPNDLVKIVDEYFMRDENEVIAALKLVPALILEDNSHFLTRNESLHSYSSSGLCDIFDGLTYQNADKKTYLSQR